MIIQSLVLIALIWLMSTFFQLKPYMTKPHELLFAPYLLFSEHFCPDQVIQPADAMEVIYTIKDRQKLCFEVKLASIFYDNHFFTFLSVIYLLIAK